MKKTYRFWEKKGWKFDSFFFCSWIHFVEEKNWDWTFSERRALLTLKETNRRLLKSLKRHRQQDQQSAGRSPPSGAGAPASGRQQVVRVDRVQVPRRVALEAPRRRRWRLVAPGARHRRRGRRRTERRRGRRRRGRGRRREHRRGAWRFALQVLVGDDDRVVDDQSYEHEAERHRFQGGRSSPINYHRHELKTRSIGLSDSLLSLPLLSVSVVLIVELI